jgi:hypothetical protein
MNPALNPQPCADPVLAMAHAIGFIAAVAVGPLLVIPLRPSAVLATCVVALATVAALRLHLGIVIHDLLDPGRAEPFLRRADATAAVLGSLSTCAVCAFLSPRVLQASVLMLLVGLLATLGCLFNLAGLAHRWLALHHASHPK